MRTRINNNIQSTLIFVVISIYFNLFQSISIYSQTDSLYHYLEIAAKNNPTVLQRYAEYVAALQKVPQVGGLPDPELSMGVFLSPMEQLGGKQVADLRLMQMFPWFGVLKNAKDEMSLMAKAKYESFRDAKMEVLYNVQLTWFELFKIQQDIRISEKNIEILRSIERMSLVKFSSASAGRGSSATSASNMSSNNGQNTASNASSMGGGMSGSSNNSQSASNTNQAAPMGSSSNTTGLADLYRIQIEIGELENSLALLKNQQNTVLARFNNYLDRSVESAVSLPDTLKPDTLSISLLAVSDSIRSNNPMLGMLNYEQQSLDAKKKMVTRMSYPMVGLGLNYSLINKSDMSTSAMNGKDMIMPMVTVTLPIYRKKYRAMQSEANLMKSASEEGLKASSNSLENEYYEAIQFYQDAQRRMALYENQSQLANKSLDITIKSFSVSGANLADILRVRQQTLDYEFKQVEALTDYNKAIAWIKRLMACTQIQ